VYSITLAYSVTFKQPNEGLRPSVHWFLLHYTLLSRCNPLMPTVAICHVLSPERQSARMSKITPSLAQDALYVYPCGNTGHQRVSLMSFISDAGSEAGCHSDLAVVLMV